MQRIGRVDRRMDPVVEKKLISDHPNQAPLRGRVAYWNFLPPDDLDRLLAIYSRVAGKTLRISKLFGIEGKKLLRPDDDYDALKDFNHSYEGEQSPEEILRNELRALVQEDSTLAARLEGLPGRTFSGKKHPKPDTKAIFFCYALPGRDPDGDANAGPEGWTEEDGKVVWLYREVGSEKIVDDPSTIAEWIRSRPNTARKTDLPRETLADARAAVEKHLKNGYLRQVQAPAGVRPILKAWMELN
jgi:hypothetical protein